MRVKSSRVASRGLLPRVGTLGLLYRVGTRELLLRVASRGLVGAWQDGVGVDDGRIVLSGITGLSDNGLSDQLSLQLPLVAVSHQTGQAEPVDDPAKPQKTEGEEVEEPPDVTSQVEMMQAQESEREAKDVGVVQPLLSDNIILT